MAATALDQKLYAPILEKCLAYLGLPNNYALVGGETFGQAFKSNGKIYKITTDKTEAIESKKLLGKRNQYLADIYEVKKINTELTDVDLYLIVLEPLNTNRKAMFGQTENAVNDLIEKHYEGYNYMDFLHAYRYDPQEYEATYGRAVDEIFKGHPMENYYYQSLIRIVDELKKNNITSLDVHWGNLGTKPNGNLGFFDMGFGDVHDGTVSAINVKEAETFNLATHDEDEYAKDEYGDKTNKVIGKKPYTRFVYKDDLGGEATGRIEGDTASIIQMNSVPSEFKYTAREPEFKRRGFFTNLLGTLKKNGINKLRISLQSSDTIAAAQKLLQKGVLADPSGIVGSSGTEHPTKFTINERVLTYMKGGSSVEVKDKCKLGGGATCEKGDINNFKIKPMNEGQDEKIEYGVVMLKLPIKNWKDITDRIEKEDIYDKPTFGIEDDPHVTILYGLHKEVTSEDAKKALESVKGFGDEIEIELIGISFFETPNYDVVKFDVKSPELTKMNDALKELPFTSDYPDYHPHLTISYVNKGTGKKYESKLPKPLKLKSKKIEFSTVDKKKTMLSEGRWQKMLNRKWDDHDLGSKDGLTEEEMETKLRDVGAIKTTLEEIDSIIQNQMTQEAVKVGINDLPFKRDIEAAGGKIYSVGGAVRDGILGRDSKDLDLLITGVPLENLETILAKYGRVDSVGKSFGIIKFNTPQTGELDIAIPRTERKNDTGGYQGFDVTSDHNLPIEKDLERRDFTINAIAKDADGLVVDPYDGRGDIERKQIKMVNPQAFSEDPLRMLRAVQFAARFDFGIEANTMSEIQKNASKLKEISPERILIELDKIVTKGDMVTGAKLLRQTGLYDQIFGVSRGLNLADFNNTKTMGEFIYSLSKDAVPNPAEFFKTKLKGDLATYNEIKALMAGGQFNGDKKTIYNMYKVAPSTVDTDIFGPKFKEAVAQMRQMNLPFAIKDIPINGNELMELGFAGPEIAQAYAGMLTKMYRGELKNEREPILYYLQTLKK